jgi:hypothetical protein
MWFLAVLLHPLDIMEEKRLVDAYIGVVKKEENVVPAVLLHPLDIRERKEIS